MMTLTRKPLTWIIPLALVALGAAVLALSPEEATLGANVRIVYLHVSLTRAGETGLVLAGLLGMAALVRPSARLDGWSMALSRVGLGFYIAGLIISMVAEQIIWNGISLQEPRMLAALDVLAAAAIVQVLLVWLPNVRIRGALHIVMAAVIVWALISAQNVLHPGAAIGASNSSAIKLYAYALLGVCLLAAGWLAWSLRQPRPAHA